MTNKSAKTIKNAGKLSRMMVQLTPQNGVSCVVKRVGLLFLVAGALALTGCGAVEGVKSQVKRETFAPQKPNVENVSLHVYLDRSGSAQKSREDISKQLMDLVDLYPAAPEITLHWYSQECIKIVTTVASRTNLTDVMSQYVSDTHDDDKGIKGTNLSTAFRDLEMQSSRESGKQIIGIFVTDGGFEDDQSVLGKEAEVLRDIPNVNMIIFVGLDADGTKKLNVLDDVVRDKFIMGTGGEAQKQFFAINLNNGGPMLAQAKEAITNEIATSK
jgi:hypothetical protein